MASLDGPAYRSIAQLSADAAAGLHFSPKYGLKVWLNSATALQDRGRALEDEGDLEQAFVLTARAATLMVEKIPAHPEAAKHLTAEHRSNLKAHGQQCLKDLARMRAKLLQLEHIRGTAPPPSSSKGAQRPLDSERKHSSTPPPFTQSYLHPSAGFSSRQRASSGASTSSEHEGRIRGLDVAFRGMQVGSSSSRLDGPPPYQAGSWNPSPSPTPPNAIIAYPSMPDPKAYTSSRAHTEVYNPTYGAREPKFHDHGQVPPPALPQRPTFPVMCPEDRQEGAGYYARTGSTTVSAAQLLARLESPRPPKDPIPSSDNSRHATSYAFTGTLRRLRLPTSILPTFLSLASRNTARGTETCALLLGTIELRFGAVEELVVEMLLVPKQKGTSDTCVMEEEEGVVGVQLERGLTALGWVSQPIQVYQMCPVRLIRACKPIP